MASRELVLVGLDVASDLFGGVFIHEPNGTFIGRRTITSRGRGGLLEHGGTDGVFGMMRCWINFGFVGFIDDGVLDSRERTLQRTLLSLDGKVLFQDGRQVGGHSGGHVCIGEGRQLVGNLSPLADKDG